MCPRAGGTRGGGPLYLSPCSSTAWCGCPQLQRLPPWEPREQPGLKAGPSQDGAEHEGTPCSILQPLGQPGSEWLAKCAAVWLPWLWHWTGELSSNPSPPSLIPAQLPACCHPAVPSCPDTSHDTSAFSLYWYKSLEPKLYKKWEAWFYSKWLKMVT